MVVLAIGILGLAPMIVLSIEGNTISRDYSIASELAKEQLEYYESVDWPMPEDTGLDEDDSLGMITVALTEVDGYSRNVTIEAADGSNPPSLCKVKVSITWTTEMGQLRSTTHSTLIVNN